MYAYKLWAPNEKQEEKKNEILKNTIIDMLSNFFFF